LDKCGACRQQAIQIFAVILPRAIAGAKITNAASVAVNHVSAWSVRTLVNMVRKPVTIAVAWQDLAA